MTKPQAVCVYCGASPGCDASYLDVARLMGGILGRNKVELIYGGGSLGLMGATAQSALEAGGRVTGIIPKFLREVEVQLDDVSELIVTSTMHERKIMMFDRSDAFVALPGGMGTLEEVVEVLSWAHLNQHKKPVILVNTHGFWRPLITLFEHMIEREFLKPKTKNLWTLVETPDQVLPAIERLAGETRQKGLAELRI